MEASVVANCWQGLPVRRLNIIHDRDTREARNRMQMEEREIAYGRVNPLTNDFGNYSFEPQNIPLGLSIGQSSG